MSSSLYAQGNAIRPVTGVDFSASLGKAVKFAAGVPAVNDSATVPAIAIVLDGGTASQQSTLGFFGGLTAPVLVQIAGDSAALKFGDTLMQKADGTFTKDVGPGTARCVLGTVTDPAGAVAGQLVAAQLYPAHTRV